ncbi:MAG: glycosyltransferase [Hyphomicrobiaceae bacterium]
MSGADVSVIIPAYEARETIAAAVGSALRQSGIGVEIVICADDGVDYVSLLARAGVAASGIVQCRSPQPRSGPASARNMAVAHASAEFIACLDADDEFDDGRLARLLSAAGRDGAAAGPTREFDEHGKLRRTAAPDHAGGALSVADIASIRMPYFPVFHRDLIGPGWPCLSFAEDMIFNVGLATRVPSYAFVNEATYSYHRRAGSLSYSDDTLARSARAYGEILSYLDDCPWPQAARATVRTIIEEDLRRAKSALNDRGNQAEAWRRAVSTPGSRNL